MTSKYKNLNGTAPSLETAKFYVTIGVHSKALKPQTNNSIKLSKNTLKRTIKTSAFGLSSMISTDCLKSLLNSTTLLMRLKDQVRPTTPS